MKKMKSTVVSERFSGYCLFCGTPCISGMHHLIFGRGNRKMADEDGLTVPVCSDCHVSGELLKRIHDNIMAEKLSKMLGQAVFERNECAKGESLENARKKFQERYNGSFL